MPETTHTEYSYPKYPVPLGLMLQAAFAIITGRRRSFKQDAQRMVSRLGTRLHVSGQENIPTEGGYIITINHYSRPGFSAWWRIFPLSALVDKEIHWLITDALTFRSSQWSGLLRPVTEWVFSRVARTYGFTTTPPIPAEPHRAQARADAVRRVLKIARSNPRPVIGISPEGRDFPGGKLGWPPAGTGRFIYYLNQAGYAVLPAAIYEENGHLQVRIGAGYDLGNPHSHATGEIHPETFRLVTQRQIDLLLTRTIMRRIAVLLPEDLHGDFE